MSAAFEWGCQLDDMAWAEPLYPIQRVNFAGRSLVRFLDGTETDDDVRAFDSHIDIINNWRSSHSYPLNIFQNNLRYSATKVDREALIAQRIKRLFSIGNKLSRSPTMKLSQMQDIGGCRAVLSSVEDVRKLVSYYQETSSIKHHPGPVDDYITNPKESGYRGVHLVYRFFSDKKKSIYNGMKVEMQVRSRYQHAWATAVETVGTFVGQALKTSIGSEEWLRFFALMGSAVALRERTPVVPNTPTDQRELVSQLSEYANRLDVANRLNGYADALSYMQNDVENAHWYLLRLDPGKGELSVLGFKQQEIKEAEQHYAESEKHVRDNPGTDAVLVSVDSVSALQKAYPNYFADTNVFLELVEQAISGHSRHIGTSKRKVKERQLSLPLDSSE